MTDFPAGVRDKAAWVDLRELDDNGEGLTEFEITFVESITKQLRAGAILTDRQRDVLADIREKRL